MIGCGASGPLEDCLRAKGEEVAAALAESGALDEETGEA